VAEYEKTGMLQCTRDETDRFKGTFVVTFKGEPEPVAAAFNKVPGVRMAYVAHSRSAMVVTR
jgi:hypothetical protein